MVNDHNLNNTNRFSGWRLGRVSDFTDEQRADFLRIFAGGAAEADAAEQIGASTVDIYNWKTRNKEFRTEYRTATFCNILALERRVQNILDHGATKDSQKIAYYNQLIRNRKNYLSRTSINIERMCADDRVQNIRKRLFDDNLQYEHVKPEIEVLEAEHKMNMDDLAQRLEVVEQSLKNE